MVQRYVTISRQRRRRRCPGNRCGSPVAEVEGQIARHWVWYLVLGIVLLLGGIAAIAFPFLSTITAKLALGWIFLVTGVVTVVHGLWTGNWRGFLWNLLIGILVSSGAYLVLLPLAGIVTLTMLIAVVLFADGIGDYHGPPSTAAFRLGLGSRQRRGRNHRRRPDRLAAAVIGNLGNRRAGRDQDEHGGLSFIALALGATSTHPTTSMRPA